MDRLPDGQYRLSVAAWPGHYVYMQDSFTGNVRSCRGDPGPQGYWHLTSHPNYSGYYLLSTRRWPDCFIFMENSFSGNIRGWSNCDPGSQGYWKLVPVSARGGEKCFFLTPQAWENSNWFAYMDSWIFGDLSAWKEDPGPQGWFIVEPFRSNDAGFQAPLVMTSERLATLPRLTDAASGYIGPSPVLKEPQRLSEIRLEVVKADGVNFASMQPTERSLVFHIDQSRAFIQLVGRQAQQAFFDEFVPDRELWSSLSRKIFELRLEPPGTSPTLVKLSNTGVLCVGSTRLNTNQAVQVGHGTCIGFGVSEHRVFLEVKVSLRQSSAQEVAATCANLRGANAGRSERSRCLPSPQMAANSGYSSSYQTGPPAVSSPSKSSTTPFDSRPPAPLPASRNDSHSKNGSNFATALPGGSDFATAIAPSPSPSSVVACLECIFSAGLSDLSTANVTIPLRPDESLTIGRSQQLNFFERLLPSKEDLQYISRSHVQAYLNSRSRTVEITNQSQNAVRIDWKTVSCGQKGEMTVGSSMKFMAGDRSLVSFMLKFA